MGERESLLLLGYILFATGRLDKAERVLAGLVRLFPGDAEAERLLAAVYARLGKAAEVLSIVERQTGAPLSREHLAVLHWLRAGALWDLGLPDKARESLEVFRKWRESLEDREVKPLEQV